MDINLDRRARGYSARRRRNRIWKKLVTALGCLVVFCTTYALILPAITMEREPVCGLSEHVHSDSCYSRQRGALICTLAESEGHTHTDACKGTKRVLSCTTPESDGHTHGEGCYDAEGVLTCTLPETQGHHHSDSCYRTEEVFVCGKAESAPHHHTDECYAWETVATCGSQEHTHTDSCYPTKPAETTGATEMPADSTTDATTAATENTESTDPTDFTAATEETTLQEEDSEALTANMHFSLAIGSGNAGHRIRMAGMALFSEGRAAERLNDYITAVTVMHRDPNNSQWVPLSSDGIIPEGDLIRFTIAYELDGRALGDSETDCTNQVHYQLPMKSTQATSGEVRNSQGAQVGTYTINENGLITVTFFEEYVKKNVAGTDIVGTISFDSTAEEKNFNTGEDGKIRLPFTSDQTVSFTIQKTVKGDLTVNKQAEAGPDENGVISYKITVSSQNGTAGNPVNLSDVMSKIKYQGGLTVTDRNGNAVPVSAPADGAESFDLKLPAMSAGDTYTITYTAKAEKPAQGSIDTTNSVTVESKEADGDILQDTDVETVSVAGMTLKKTGILNAEKTQIAWSITVGEAGTNLSGWEMTDHLNGQLLTLPAGGLTAIAPNGSTIPITELPFTFPDGTIGPVTIDYVTPAETALGRDGAENKVTVTPPGKNPISSTGYVKISDESYNPLKKTGDSLVVGENGVAVITWTLHLDTAQGSVANWVLYDNLDTHSGQYFTQEQRTAFETAFAKAIRQINNLADDADVSEYYTIRWNQNGDKVYGAEITGKQPLPMGKQVNISYQTTAPIGDGSTRIEFKNGAHFNNCWQPEATITYVPGEIKIEKVGLFNGKEEAGDSEHPYIELKDGLIEWKLKLQLPETVDGDVVIEEMLPDKVSLYELYYGYDSFGFSQPNNQGVSSLERNGIRAEKQTDGSLIIRIPHAKAQELAGQSITFTVSTKLNSLDEVNNLGGEVKVSLNNSVKVKVGQEERGSDTHTQTITNQKPAITKSGKPDGTSRLEYTLRVNQGGVDLLKDSTTMVVKDQMQYWNSKNDNNNFNATLLVDDIHVNALNPDGTKGESVTFTYTYDKKTTYPFDNTNACTTCTLLFTVPDNRPLYITYVYRISGKTNVGTNFVNKASVEQLTEEDYGSSSENSQWIHFTDSMASANVNHLKISKVDAANYEKLLKGAKFELRKYNGSNYVKDREITVETGSLTLDDLDFNTAYYLTETEAPRGYLLDTTPHYFLLYSDAPDCKNPDGSIKFCKPDDFDPGAFTFGDATLQIANERAKTYKLPQTGGGGTRGFTLGGALVTVGGLYLLTRKKRRRRDA